MYIIFDTDKCELLCCTRQLFSWTRIFMVLENTYLCVENNYSKDLGIHIPLNANEEMMLFNKFYLLTI